MEYIFWLNENAIKTNKISQKNSLNVRERHRGKQTNKHKYREKQQQQIDAKFHWKLTKVKINVHRGNHTPSKRFSNRIQFQKSMLSLSMKMKREKNEEKKTKRGRLLRIVHSLIGSTLVIKWDWNVYYLASMELVHPEMIKKKHINIYKKSHTSDFSSLHWPTHYDLSTISEVLKTCS